MIQLTLDTTGEVQRVREVNILYSCHRIQLGRSRLSDRLECDIFFYLPGGSVFIQLTLDDFTRAVSAMGEV